MGHKKRKTKYYTFLLIPDNERATKSVKFKASLLRAFFAFLIIIIILIGFGASTYWKVAEVALNYRELEQENISLQQGVARVEELKDDIERLKKMQQKLTYSISGYVSIVDDQTKGESNFLEGFDVVNDVKYDRSIFSFIPDLYPVDGFITRGYESGSLLKNSHMGVDIASSEGSPIKATADGVVLFSGWTYEEGNVVIVKHKLNFYSFYKHNMQNLCNELDYVKKGQVIALLGDTGEISSGAHLHFEIWKGLVPVNPENYLRAN